MMRNHAQAVRALSAALAWAVLLLWSLGALAQPRVEVRLEGIEGELADNVRAYLSLIQSPPDSEAHLRRLYRQAPAEIEQALAALGHYRPRIEPALNPDGEAWVAEFRIDPGPPVRVTRFALTLSGAGAEDRAFRELRGRLPVKEGDVLHHGRYAEAKRSLQNLALARGYFDARFTRSEVRVERGADSAEVILDYDTGPRYRFGAVRFGDSALEESFLRRFVTIEPGDPYLVDRITALQTALVNSDYFAEVNISAPPEEAEGLEVPVRVELVDRRRHKYSFGLGYGTDTGPRASAGWESRRIRRNGERANAQLELSAIRYALTAGYEIPLAKPMSDRLLFQASLRDESTDTAESTSLLLSARRVESLESGWLRDLSLNFLEEYSTVAGEEVDARLLYPAVGWTRVDADDRMRPRRGRRLGLEVKGSDPALGSDARFLQGRVDAKFIEPLGAGGRVLARGNLGATLVEDVESLPASLRFFAGGDQSVRGYGYNELGPENSAGDVIGGRFLLVGSVEYEHRITGNWSAAAFYDVGNALDDWDGELKQGVGAGLRWQSPVGPIRVDLAVAVSEPGTPLRLHFNMGPDL
ncbi:autotransporter assembly complex protein TamA [Thioalbus denitrificans]|uniref:Translocation and assembly module subunit TamA n=1 Tax=Thioalbus denitrificans TaxID=547122 RepID=A0A369C132_9GAMM|nr:autotransporter assembly complex family protein [Thioalbus denitrificans]RCX26377.1 autotransporter secretion outer membrane protein TamA [Thioalbus denitrificans]